jgi:hypothetical protein
MSLLLFHASIPPLGFLNCPIPRTLALKVFALIGGIGLRKLEFGFGLFALEFGGCGGVDRLSSALGVDFFEVCGGGFFLDRV